MSKKYSVMLFAAGLGTRMGSLVADKPKPLIKVAGQTLIDHALQFTEIPEVGGRVVNVHYKADMIRKHLASSDIKISNETDMLRETGGGLRHALPLLGDDPVITLNSDAVWHGPNPVEVLLRAWDPKMEALLMVVPKVRAYGHKGLGDFVQQQDGRLLRQRGDIYAGLQITRTDTLKEYASDSFSMNVVWDDMASRGGLFGVDYPGLWCDVGRPESITIAEHMIAKAVHV